MNNPFAKKQTKIVASTLSTIMALAMVPLFTPAAAYADDLEPEIQTTLGYEATEPEFQEEPVSDTTGSEWSVGAYAYDTDYLDENSPPYMEWWSDKPIDSTHAVYFVDSSNGSIFYSETNTVGDYGGTDTPVFPKDESRTYYAYIAEWDASYDNLSDLTDIVATSEPVVITHSSSVPPNDGGDNAGIVSYFYADTYDFTTDQNAPTLFWDVTGMNSDVNTPQGVYILNEDTGAILYASQDAVGQFQSPRFWHEWFGNYTFYVADWNSQASNVSDLTGIATDVQWASVMRSPWSVEFSLDPYQDPNAVKKDVVVVTNQSVADPTTSTPVWAVYIVDETTGEVVERNTTMGTVQVFSNLNLVSGDSYLAYVAAYSDIMPATVSDLVDIQTSSYWGVVYP